MAKNLYKIPATLDRSTADQELPLKFSNGITLKPVPLKIALAYVFSALGLFFAVVKTPIAQLNIILIVVFIAAWLVATYVLLKIDKTGEGQYKLLGAMSNYLPKGTRIYKLRRKDSANRYAQITGIDMVDFDSGLVLYTNGWVGYFYEVVGSASILLFDSDKTLILDRVDNFWRKLRTDFEIGFITAKEPQKVYRQLASVKKRRDALSDPELHELCQLQFDYLRNYVGRDFRSIHQYLYLIAPSKEQLDQAKNWLRAEVQSSSYVFKRCRPLLGDDLGVLLDSIYTVNSMTQIWSENAAKTRKK